MTQSFNELYCSVKNCITNTCTAKVSLFGIAKRTKRKTTRLDEILTGQYTSTIKKLKRTVTVLPSENSVCGHRFCMKGGANNG